MAVKFERVREFARKHGRVDAFASPGTVAVLPNGNLDVIDYVEKATRFYFDGKSYTNEEFTTKRTRCGWACTLNTH